MKTPTTVHGRYVLTTSRLYVWAAFDANDVLLIEAEAFAAGVAAAREPADAFLRWYYEPAIIRTFYMLEERVDALRAALAAIDAIGAGEAHRGSDPYVVPDGLPPTNPPDSNARQENPR